MDAGKAYETLLDWMESVKSLHPAAVCGILISTGSQLAYDCAPVKESADKVIQESIKMGFDAHEKDKQK